MITFIYGLLMGLMRLTLPLFRLIPHKKIQFFALYQGQVSIKKSYQEKPIWIHASSGEIEYAHSLIREIRQNKPSTPILVTHTSLSSQKVIEKLDVHAIGVLPLDEKKTVQTFLNHIQPRICLLARTDLWPEMISELKKRKIPCSLFSATFAKGSKKTGLFSTLFLKSAIRNLSSIYFVAQEDQILCESLYGPMESSLVLGDTRYDQVIYRLQQKNKFQLPYAKNILLLGSTWEPDEQVLLPIVQKLKELSWKFVWAPHEVNSNHILKIQNHLQQLNLKVGKLSEHSQTWSWQNFDVLLVDEVGHLASLYPFCQMAFVGGSFKKQVHSVMEPLAAGCPVLVGPYYHNNREALEFKDLGYVFEFQKPEEGFELCQKIAPQSALLKVQILKEVQLRTGATQRLMSQLQSLGIFDARSLEPHNQSH